MRISGINNVTIVGANGQMGGLFCRAFTDQGCTVAKLDLPHTEEDIQAALGDCDMLMLSIPVTAMNDVLKRMVPYLKPGAILCDVGSVKVMPVKAMVAHYDGPVVGTHPLFGPVIPNGFEPRIAVTPGRESDTEAGIAVCELMTKCGYTCFHTTPDEHDKAMAFVQGLNFTSTVAFLAAARDVDGIENFITPSFNRRLDSARKMLNTDMELFETISEANPYLQETNRKFMSYLGLAAGGDLDLLADRAQWWWRNKESY